GYAGQFYEVEASAPFWVWGAVSTVFFLVLLVLVRRVVYGSLDRLPEEARSLARGVFWLLLASWMLYPGAYLMPYLIPPGLEASITGWAAEAAVVGRTMTYTVADVTSKVIYGVLLTIVAQILSNEAGYNYNETGESV
ncbi:MAG: bacteriorhodopsin, partial [Cyclonatronaceae bacterium]